MIEWSDLTQTQQMLLSAFPASSANMPTRFFAEHLDDPSRRLTRAKVTAWEGLRQLQKHGLVTNYKLSGRCRWSLTATGQQVIPHS